MMKYDEFLKLMENHYDVIIKMFFAAQEVHENVNQKYDGKLPYSYHLAQVGLVAAKYGHLIVINEDDIMPLMFAAFFHDAIEDARLTYNDIVKKAKEYMDDESAVLSAELVYALTNEKGKNRAERESYKYFEDMKKICGAPFLKFCDRIANMKHARATKSSLFKKYKKELPVFIARIGDYVPEEMVEELKAIAGD